MGIKVNFTPALTLTDSGIEASGFTDIPWNDDQSNFIDHILGQPGWLQTFITNVLAYGTVDDAGPPHKGALPRQYWGDEYHRGSYEGHPRLVGAESGDWRAGKWYPRSFYNPDPTPTEPSYLRLEAVSATIKHITQEPLIVASAHWGDDSETVDDEHSITLSHSETQSLSVSTVESHEVAEGVSITVEGKMPIGGDASDTESVTVTNSVEHSTTNEHSTTLESAGELKATLKPGEKVVAALTIYKGTVTAEVVVNASLHGCMELGMNSFKQTPHGMFQSFAAGPTRQSDVNIGDFDWRYVADNAPLSLVAKAVTVEVKADFYSRLDADIWDVASFSEDDVNRAVWGDPSPGVQVVYDGRNVYSYPARLKGRM